MELVGESLQKELESKSSASLIVVQINSISDPYLWAKIDLFKSISMKMLPSELVFFERAWANWLMNGKIDEAIKIVKYTLELARIEKKIETKIAEGRIFDSAIDKIKTSAKIFQEGDEAKYPSVMNDLNSALELILKDKLGIPTTLSKVNTARIIDVLVSNKIGPYLYFSEAKKHISSIDNKIKHQGYKPNKIDCINAMKASEDLETQLKNVELKLSEDVRNKIYEGI